MGDDVGAGTVGVFQFTEGELGRAGSNDEMEEVMQGRYGSRQRGAGGGLVFAESIEQLEEEEAPQQRQPSQQQQQQEQEHAPQRAAVQPAGAPTEGAAGRDGRLHAC
jgi:hypothetical protein